MKRFLAIFAVVYFTVPMASAYTCYACIRESHGPSQYKLAWVEMKRGETCDVDEFYEKYQSLNGANDLGSYSGPRLCAFAARVRFGSYAGVILD